MVERINLSQFILPYSIKLPMVCPYCNENAHFSQGLWRCNPCNSLAKVQSNSKKPLGTMANQALWNARKRTLQSFGKLMGYWIDEGLSKTQARKRTTNDLILALDIPLAKFNIDCFNEELCTIANIELEKLHKSCTPICPYCNTASVFVESKRIYRCDPCDAQVGVHKHNNKPLGSLANADLREARKKAHGHFDPLWRYKIKRDQISISQARKSAYRWLAKEMNLEVSTCHIGEFNLLQCQEVVNHCQPYIAKAMEELQKK